MFYCLYRIVLHYRSQVRLRKGNVFIGICLFTWGGGVTPNASWDRSHGRGKVRRVPLPPGHQTSGDMGVITRDLFILVHLGTPW